MNPTDTAALSRALAQTRSEPDRTEQIDLMLRESDWYEVAQFASYHRQTETLGLPPWQIPPCAIEGDPSDTLALPRSEGAWRDGDHEAAALVKELEALGLSRYEPDPLKAIEFARRKRS